MKRVLVTGASGFVGSHLVNYLHKKGFEVWASFHRRRKKFSFFIHWVRADLTSSRDAFKLLQASRPHYIFHLAAQAKPSESWKQWGLTMRLNVGASISLLEAMVRQASKARILLASSAQVYGARFSEKTRVQESDSPIPKCPYAGSKLLMELAALNFAKVYGMDLVIVRSLNCIGRGQAKGTIFSDFCRQVISIERGRRPAVVEVGNLNVVRDFLHVSDAVRAYVLLARRGKRAEIYNVASGRGIQLKKTLDFLAQESRTHFQIKSVASRSRRNDLPYAVANITKLRKLGWKPQKSVWDGLKDVLEDCRERRKKDLENGPRNPLFPDQTPRSIKIG